MIYTLTLVLESVQSRTAVLVALWYPIRALGFTALWGDSKVRVACPRADGGGSESTPRIARVAIV